MTSDKQRGNSKTLLYLEAECKTNRDNARCLMVLAAICILCDFLNEIKVFEVSPIVMRIGAAVGALLFLMPSLILLRPLDLMHRGSTRLVYRQWHKYMIIAFAWLGTAITCIMLTHHTVIVMAIPIMIMAQYRNTKKLIHVTIVLGTVCVLLGLYGGFFLGCFDANLLHLTVSNDNAANLALRLQLATPKRMYELFTHYAIGRELIVLALIFFASRISRRNNEMLDRQVNLQSIAAQEMKKKNDIQWQIIDGMANLIENRDTSTGEHVKRTRYYVQSIVAQLQKASPYSNQLSENKAYNIVRAAPLHDIGKIVVSDLILQKPSRLTAEEFEEIKLHASEGVRVIKNVLGNVEDEDFLKCASEIAGGHHERWDGQGYPGGLCKNNIPLSARIMAVADVFDALVSQRVYKDSMSPEDAFDIIEKESGKQFDPEVVKAFLTIRPQIMNYLASSAKKYVNVLS